MNKENCRYMQILLPEGSLLLIKVLEELFFCGVLLIIMVKNIPMFYIAFYTF